MKSWIFEVQSDKINDRQSGVLTRRQWHTAVGGGIIAAVDCIQSKFRAEMFVTAEYGSTSFGEFFVFYIMSILYVVRNKDSLFAPILKTFEQYPCKLVYLFAFISSSTCKHPVNINIGWRMSFLLWFSSMLAEDSTSITSYTAMLQWIQRCAVWQHT